LSVAFDTIGHPTNLGGELWEKKRMSNILSEMTALVDYKKKVQDTTKKAVTEINTLASVNTNLSRSLDKIQSKADKKKQTIQRNYEKQLLNIDSEFKTKIQTISKQIEENKLTITSLYSGIENLNGSIGFVTSVEPTSDTTESKPRQKYVRFHSQLTTQMIKNIIIELVNNEEKGAIKIKVVMTQLEKRHGNIITHEERTGGSNSRLYGRVYAILGKMRKDGELYKGTGDGIVVRKVSSLETLTETA
jgi:uncharacterized protein Yka (UPF0111/DUF47 family)